ncbi:hypothetical protein [Paenibacillus sp. FSL W8-0194]|uniref:hypothetical protein n=1 Tax=Paenibacillus sp. FSL W8-0194 TaxID=2921711 RepID=UPI0030DB686C
MKKWYLKLQGDIVKDVIEFPYEGYTEIELGDGRYLPDNILGRYYRWDGTDFVFDAELKNEIDQMNRQPGYEELKAENEKLKSRVSDLEMTMAEIMFS